MLKTFSVVYFPVRATNNIWRELLLERDPLPNELAGPITWVEPRSSVGAVTIHVLSHSRELARERAFTELCSLAAGASRL